MKLVVASGKSVAEVAKAHEISDSVVSTWVRQTRIDAGQGPVGALTTEERAELAALRKDCRVPRSIAHQPDSQQLSGTRLNAAKYALIRRLGLAWCLNVLTAPRDKFMSISASVGE